MRQALFLILAAVSPATIWPQKAIRSWPPDDEICQNLIRLSLGSGFRYLTYELFPLQSENDGLAILYTRDRDTLWCLYQWDPNTRKLTSFASDLTAWYARNRNAFPENELLVEKSWKEACYRMTLYQLWGFNGSNRLTKLWEATDREMDQKSCKESLRPCTLLEESHSPHWLDLDGDGIPEWVDNIRLIHLKDTAKKSREEFYAIQIWRWLGHELRLTGMDFSP
jgi:hypothetical protein